MATQGSRGSKDTLKLITLNVNEMRRDTKRRAIFADLHNCGADIIFLQETHSTSHDQRIWLSEWGGEGRFSHGRSNSRGVATLFKRGHSFEIKKEISDQEGRFLLLQIKVREDIFTFLNIYAPTQSQSRDQDDFIQKVGQTLDNLEITDLFVGGDFNTQLHLGSHSSTSSNSYSSGINSLMKDYSLSDLWQEKFPSNHRGTFHRGTYSARLDYWLIPSHLTPQSSIKISPHPLSDHSVVTAELTLSNNIQGPGYWRFKNELLKDHSFITEMRTFLDEIITEKIGDPNTQWEWIKYKIRWFSIKYSIQRNRKRNELVKQLTTRLQTLASNYDLSASPDIADEAASLKRELGEIKQAKASSAIFSSKVRWSMYGERPSSYFLGLEKRRSRDSTITTLIDDEGQSITDSKSILNMERDFFTKIYKEDPTNLDPIEDLPRTENDVPKISDISNILINRPFSEEEFLASLKELNKGKAPGSDGLTPEFYITFWDLLKHDFMESITFSIDRGRLSDQQRTGIITLIPKKGLDRRYLSNWRPITLLNTDLKIMSKALANRIQTCIKEVVSEDQTGFIRGRSIGTNLMNTQSVIDYTDATDKPGFILALDFSKAFDMVRWQLIEEALYLFNFGEFIISVVKTLFSDIKSCVVNSGFSSGFFYPTRGIRQGCCASPSLFTLAVELLAILVKKNTEITGITIGNRTAVISQYADDATFFIQDAQAVKHLLCLLERFSVLSGLRINVHKSHLLLLGKHKDPPSSIGGIKTTDQVKILGIVYKAHMREDEHFALNFEDRIFKIQQICCAWINRILSLKGKITLINSLMISVLQYPSSYSYTPTRVWTEVKKIVAGFLWNNGRSKIAYNLMIQDIPAGGLKLADFETRIQAAHISMIRRAWHNPNTIWASTLSLAVGSPNLRDTLISKTRLVHKLSTHYPTFKQILQTWMKFHSSQPKSEEEVRS